MKNVFLLLLICLSATVKAQRITYGNRVPDPRKVSAEQFERIKGKIQTAAEQTAQYVPYLKGKKVGMVVNPTSVIGDISTVDHLKALGVNIVRIFGPEHGFRGEASAGVRVDDSVDKKTGIKVVSLYGRNYKPGKEDIAAVDVMVFDIQDVGVRFYTYINTLQYVMEACAENGKELVVLDRPNPNGSYVDGPVLEPHLKSGIGVNTIPIVHGLTVAEYAQMLNGEGWLAGKQKCRLKIIKVANYAHGMDYTLPVKPSPNLNTQQSIYLYPSLCLFEGTIISQGRGTQFPFTVLGSPALAGRYSFSFTPKSIPGMSETPLHQDKTCYGLDLRKTNFKKLHDRINLSWLMELYKAYPQKEAFFDMTQSNQMGNFDKLAGTESLRKQIIAGKSETEIRQSWEPALSQYKVMRKKYLLYP